MGAGREPAWCSRAGTAGGRAADAPVEAKTPLVRFRRLSDAATADRGPGLCGIPGVIHDAKCGCSERRQTAIPVAFMSMRSRPRCRACSTATPALAGKGPPPVGTPMAARDPWPPPRRYIGRRRRPGRFVCLVVGGSQGRGRGDERHRPRRGRTAWSRALWGRLTLTQQVREEDMARGAQRSMTASRSMPSFAPFFTDLPARLASNHLVVLAFPAPGRFRGTRRRSARPSILGCRCPGAIDSGPVSPMPASCRRVNGRAADFRQTEFTPDRLGLGDFGGSFAEPQRLAADSRASRPRGRPARCRRTAWPIWWMKGRRGF